MFDWCSQPRSPAVSQEKRWRLRSKASRVSASTIVTVTYIGPATAPHASSARVDNVCFSIVSPSGHRGSPSCWTGGGGLEELDDVAGGVLEQYLLAAGSFEDVVAEPSTGAAETGH